MKTYVAIGHFKDSENITSVAFMQNTKRDFMRDCYGNEFVPYVVLTESMVARVAAAAAEPFGIYEQVKKLTTNYRVWDKVADYLEQCFDVIEEKIKAAQA